MQRFGAADAGRQVAVPRAGDDKYSRGVLGVITGSDRFPGAAVLGVEGAARTGVGMIRYLGPDRASDFVLRARPETVTADGRVQAWLIGSGMSRDDRTAEQDRRIDEAARGGLPVVLDAGALDVVDRVRGLAVLTPHFGELVALLADRGVHVEKADVAADPARWAERAGAETGRTVLLKGATTYIADASGLRWEVPAGPPWVATAGAGDVLGGVLGALVATHAPLLEERPEALADLAAAAAWIHGEAGRRASAGGPIAALDIAAHLHDALVPLVAAG